MRVLLVEDDSKKVAAVAGVLLRAGVLREQVEHVNNGYAARQKVSKVKYDLVLVDLLIPVRVEVATPGDEGASLVEWMVGLDSERAPLNVVAISASLETRARVIERLAQWAVPVLHCALDSIAWEAGLLSRVRQVMSCVRGMGSLSGGLAIVCALDQVELPALKALQWSWEAVSFSDDVTPYWKGRFRDRRGVERSVWLACAPRMGMPAAAVLSTKMIERFAPDFIGAAGIAAGRAGKVELGDVLYASSVWDWGAGRSEGERPEEARFLPDQHQVAVDPMVEAAGKLLRQDVASLATIRRDFSGDTKCALPSVHVVPMASGAAVVADSFTMVDRVSAHSRQCVGVDMEAYGVFVAARDCRRAKVNSLCVKAVSDFGDGKKNDAIQKYAAYVSAQALRVVVEQFLEFPE